MSAHELVGCLDSLPDVTHSLLDIVGHFKEKRLELEQDREHTVPAGPAFVESLAT